LGNEGAVVLRFESPALAERWQEFKDAGASWDHDAYRPHVTITYDAGDVDLSKVKPYDGLLEFDGEVFGEVKPGSVEKAKASLQATDSAFTIAMDRDSVRSFDRDGRMRVAIANLSKEQIRPYAGREIPGWDEEKQTHALGLDPDKVYNLYCSGEELEKAAATFNGIQLLKKHTPVNAEDHKKNDIVGTTGTNAKFNSPFLQNSLVVWTKEGIDFIESEEQKELSCGYHYKPIMTPGVFQGQPFDGLMVELEGNHLTLVGDGRAGAECVVEDSAAGLQWSAIERAIENLVA
jgi:2'-5' RNA ligase